MSFDVTAIVNKLLEPQILVIWLPLVFTALGVHLPQPGYMGKKDGDQ